MTYDLRRLRTRGLITRIPHTHRYRVTDDGLRTAMVITALQDRVLTTGLAHTSSPQPTPLRVASRNYQKAIDALITTAEHAA